MSASTFSGDELQAVPMTRTNAPEYDYERCMEIEDSLQTSNVFFNGFTGRRNCHSDSYGTCVDFEELAKWRDAKHFSRERITEAVRYWKTNPNMQPPLLMIAAFLDPGPAAQEA